MRGTKTITLRLTCLLTLLLTGAAASVAAAPDYFPLQSGNSWAYRVTQFRASKPGTVNVGEAVTIDGRQYFKLQFFDKDLLVRQSEDGSMLAYNADAKTESTWLPFGAPDKQNVQTSFDDCSKSARVESRNATVKTDTGEFNNALEIRYTANCADAGATVQYFVPYVGLVHFESTSIAGPVIYDLTYSRTGVTALDTKTNAFTLATDAAVYKTGQEAEAVARVTLRLSEATTLKFPSGQSTDLRITNDRGETAYFWSADKIFIMIYRGAVPVGPGEKTWLMSFPVGRLAPGTYTAEGWLTTEPQLYSGKVTFTVQ